MVVLSEVHYVLRRSGQLGFWVNWGKAFSLRLIVELWNGKDNSGGESCRFYFGDEVLENVCG